MSIAINRESKLKAISQIRTLLLISCMLTGWLAGNSLEKYIIRIPAWRKINIEYWAEFSRHEYFEYGFYFYLIEAVGAFLLLTVALVIIYKMQLEFIKWPVIFSLLLATLIIVFTFFTAPLMNNLQNAHNNPQLIKQIFEDVNTWGVYRGIVHVICFTLCLVTLGRCYVLRYVNNS